MLGSPSQGAAADHAAAGMEQRGASLRDHHLPGQNWLYHGPNAGWAGRHDNVLIETLRLQVLSPSSPGLSFGWFFFFSSSFLKWCCLFW